jgi:hypothetical protein
MGAGETGHSLWQHHTRVVHQMHLHPKNWRNADPLCGNGLGVRVGYSEGGLAATEGRIGGHRAVAHYFFAGGTGSTGAGAPSAFQVSRT